MAAPREKKLPLLLVLVLCAGDILHQALGRSRIQCLSSSQLLSALAVVEVAPNPAWYRILC